MAPSHSAIRSERSAPQSSLRLVRGSQEADACRLAAGPGTRRILRWYADHARDLPWRRAGVSPWAIMVSEFMLQQTPVERVRGPWQAGCSAGRRPHRWRQPRLVKPYEPGAVSAIRDGRCACTKRPR